MKTTKVFTNIMILLISVFIIESCNTDTAIDSEGTVKPQIVNLSSDKANIAFGGEDPAIITCNATGGGLEYTWEVDLGNIVPNKTDNSQVRFSGSPCCIGKKVIKCTVMNDKGSDTKTVEINILNP